MIKRKQKSIKKRLAKMKSIVYNNRRAMSTDDKIS